MVTVNIHEAKTHLSRLLRKVLSGEEITIARGNTPIARLVPVRPTAPRQLGDDRGLFNVPEEFTAPLPEDVLSQLER